MKDDHMTEPIAKNVDICVLNLGRILHVRFFPFSVNWKEEKDKEKKNNGQRDIFVLSFFFFL